MATSLKLAVDLAPAARLSNVPRFPPELRGFEDLAFLFTSGPLDYGVAQLTFEEAAFLFSAAREAGRGRIVEIGRFKGGSTLVLATAMHPDATLVSYDLHAVPQVAGSDLDAELREALNRFGLAGRVELVVADSTSVPLPGECALVFVDGDHTEAGVRRDYEHWREALRPGGQLLFHDAPNPAATYAAGCEPVGRVVDSIRSTDGEWFQAVDQVGSIVRFVRTDAPLPAAP